MDAIAAKLGMSRQTLFRKLKGRRRDLREVLDELRHRMAADYLSARKVLGKKRDRLSGGVLGAGGLLSRVQALDVARARASDARRHRLTLVNRRSGFWRPASWPWEPAGQIGFGDQGAKACVPDLQREITSVIQHLDPEGSHPRPRRGGATALTLHMVAARPSACLSGAVALIARKGRTAASGGRQRVFRLHADHVELSPLVVAPACCPTRISAMMGAFTFLPDRHRLGGGVAEAARAPGASRWAPVSPPWP